MHSYLYGSFDFLDTKNHAFRYPEHEIQAAKIARKLGFINISLSNEIIPMIKIVPRGYTGSNLYLLVSNIS